MALLFILWQKDLECHCPLFPSIIPACMLFKKILKIISTLLIKGVYPSPFSDEFSSSKQSEKHFWGIVRGRKGSEHISIYS